MQSVVVAMPAALAVWFSFSYVAARRRDAAKTDAERRRERIVAERDAMNALTLTQKVAKRASRFGWHGPIDVLLWGVALVYLLCAVALSVLGVTSWWGAAGAAALTPALVAVGVRNAASRRQRKFQEQLINAFDAFAAQLKQGSSAPRAFEDLAPSLPEPLRSEIHGVVEQHRNARPLADAMNEVASRYPSRAMALFVAALRIGEERGGRLAPAMEEAAASLRRDFELLQETNAEIAQERAQFFGIVGIISGIVVVSIARATPEAREAFMSPIGVTLLSVFALNFCGGVLRVLRIFSKAKGH